jgi:hypothetical protein
MADFEELLDISQLYTPTAKEYASVGFNMGASPTENWSKSLEANPNYAMTFQGVTDDSSGYLDNLLKSSDRYGSTGNQWISGLSNMDVLRGGLGIGQLGLGALSYLENKKTADKQRELLGQQIEQNKFVLDKAKGFKEALGKHFGDSSNGLAAKSASPITSSALVPSGTLVKYPSK